jgi:hypothetical protein
MVNPKERPYTVPVTDGSLREASRCPAQAGDPISYQGKMRSLLPG